MDSARGGGVKRRGVAASSTPAFLPGWDELSRTTSRAYAEAWHTSRRSLLLLEPSVVARTELNVLTNPEHPEFPRDTYRLHQPVWWDRRLYAG